MEDRRIGRRYAQALFSASQQVDVVASVEDDLRMITRLLNEDERFRHFVFAPYTSREHKIAIAERIFSDRITALTMQVIRVMISKGRGAQLPNVYDEFLALRREHQGVRYVVVTSAAELDESERTRLIDALRRRYNAPVEADFLVEPRMIGGVRVEHDNTVLDGSVRGALSRLRERLRYDLLKQA